MRRIFVLPLVCEHVWTFAIVGTHVSQNMYKIDSGRHVAVAAEVDEAVVLVVDSAPGVPTFLASVRALAYVTETAKAFRAQLRRKFLCHNYDQKML